MLPARIHIGQRVILNIQVPVDAIGVSDRIGLHKPANVWIIVPGAVIVKTCFNIKSSAGEHVGIGVVGARLPRGLSVGQVFGRHLPVGAVLVALDAIAVRITQGKR
jgi:hypothetical protein